MGNALWDLCPPIQGCSAPKTPRAGGTPRAVAFLWRCPKPRALGGEQKLELPSPAGSRCPRPAGTFPSASCGSGGSRVACCAASPRTSCTSHISRVGEKRRFRMQPELTRCVLCPCPSFSQSGCLWALGAVWIHPCTSPHQWVVLLKIPNGLDLLKCS